MKSAAKFHFAFLLAISQLGRYSMLTSFSKWISLCFSKNILSHPGKFQSSYPVIGFSPADLLWYSHPNSALALTGYLHSLLSPSPGELSLYRNQQILSWPTSDPRETGKFTLPSLLPLPEIIFFTIVSLGCVSDSCLWPTLPGDIYRNLG